MKEGYKKTEVGVIPEDWEVKSIGDLFEFKNGLNKEKEYFGKGTKIVNYVDVYRNRYVDNSIIKGLVEVSDKEKESFNTKKGDVFFTRTSETIEEIGRTSVLIEDIEDLVYSGFVLRARPKNDELNLYYKKYCFSDFATRKEITRKSSYTTRALTSGTLLKDVLLKVPPLKEQEKIADILSTVDCQIADTDKLIEKCRQLKKGLMQRLLTKGIGHTAFKKTEIGEIPVGWKVDNDFIKIFSGFGFKYNEYSYEGVPLIKINNVTHGKILDEDWSYLPNKYKEEYKEYVIKKGDILLALNRPITQGKLKICIVNIEEAILYQRVGKLIMDSDIYCPAFYYYYMQSEKFMKKLESGLVGTDQPYIKNSEFKDIKFPIPSLDEQLKIVEVLSYIDNEIEEYENKKQKLEELKKGLMQQLLTGKIRV